MRPTVKTFETQKQAEIDAAWEVHCSNANLLQKRRNAVAG